MASSLPVHHRQALAVYKEMDEVPERISEPVLRAIKGGATMRQAAMAAGVPARFLESFVRWGRAGHVAWTPFTEMLDKARWEARRGTMKQLKEDAEAGIHSARMMYLGALDPEDFGSRTTAGAAGGTNIQINIVKDWADDDVVDVGIEDVEDLDD